MKIVHGSHSHRNLKSNWVTAIANAWNIDKGCWIYRLNALSLILPKVMTWLSDLSYAQGSSLTMMKFLIDASLTLPPKFNPNDFCDYTHWGCLFLNLLTDCEYDNCFYSYYVSLNVSSSEAWSIFGKITLSFRGPFKPMKLCS